MSLDMEVKVFPQSNDEFALVKKSVRLASGWMTLCVDSSLFSAL